MRDLYNEDEASKLELNEEALNAAIDAATEAHVAGMEEQEQLIAGIKAYIYVVREVIRAECSPTTLNEFFDAEEERLRYEEITRRRNGED